MCLGLFIIIINILTGREGWGEGRILILDILGKEVSLRILVKNKYGMIGGEGIIDFLGVIGK